MSDNIPGAAATGGPAPDGLTDAEKLAAIGTYIKVLTETEKALRARVTEDMGIRRVERVGAYLPDGTKMAAVGYSSGRKSARIIDHEAALRWCEQEYPDEIVKAVNPAFLKVLLDVAKAKGEVGEPGFDPHTGQMLGFIEVVQGSPYVSITTTKEGVSRMERLAMGFAGMLTGPEDEETGSTGPSFGAGPGEGR